MRSQSLKPTLNLPLLANMPPRIETLTLLALLGLLAWLGNVIVNRVVVRFAMRWLPAGRR